MVYFEKMTQITYTVRCRIADPAQAAAWLDWLKNGHIADVMRGGALRGQIVKMDEEGVYEVRYVFADRASFDRYLKDFAPALREEGVKLFPPGAGFEYSRIVGEVL